jgi:hypothetical protein
MESRRCYLENAYVLLERICQVCLYALSVNQRYDSLAPVAPKLFFKVRLEGRHLEGGKQVMRLLQERWLTLKAVASISGFGFTESTLVT